MNKLNIVFRLYEKEVSKQELKEYFIKKIDNVCEQVESEKLIESLEPHVLFLYIFLVCCFAAIFWGWFSSHKIFLLVVFIIIAVLLAVLICLDGSSRRTTVNQLRAAIRFAKEEDRLYDKVKFLKRAKMLAENVNGAFDLKWFNFSQIEHFFDIEDFYENNILEYSCDIDTKVLKIVYSESNGRVKYLKVMPDESYESTMAKSDTLICTGEKLIYEKAYRNSVEEILCDD